MRTQCADSAQLRTLNAENPFCSILVYFIEGRRSSSSTRPILRLFPTSTA